MQDNLEKLVYKAKEGDKNAFGEIYKTFVKKIFRFIYYLVYDRELAEDLTQLVFLKAYKSLPSFLPSKGTFQAYLYAIARNQVIDYQRRKKELSLDEVDEPAAIFEIDNEVIQTENKNTVDKLLATLDDDDKQLIIWRYFEELQFAEIAEILNENEGSIRVKMHRLLKKLKERVEKQV
ncbi:hypothetical protein A3A14_00575 [Candidatus Daviesbacteria bacterium RIFCSPLOWO2_01_FULL_43_38]|uniref:RNA polymerase sigma factor n=1 Tax=Candidatus Daviesbacteria bacterium RIFCSPHIGHO2_12_FULL_43_11 TaxID=1797780 RepID=A0A1F5K6Z4_9BACT|nr:MAG: hypothetical protein A3E45_00790 [Candidatus Daviesbacteria bacterium RIFCSPHIGHO2_12_FULL_43_11]OGE63185.1 MAG: hypothetical protein A3A14_00575 [Candidatus Daviesbacteria bacterium RIFCSPLOWO2_01_FULL_43_38]